MHKSPKLGRKSSLIELHRIQSDMVKLQKVKETKKLNSQQNPRKRIETGMDFTFAQNFSSKQIILREFSSQKLRRKFFV